VSRKDSARFGCEKLQNLNVTSQPASYVYSIHGVLVFIPSMSIRMCSLQSYLALFIRVICYFREDEVRFMVTMLRDCPTATIQAPLAWFKLTLGVHNYTVASRGQLTVHT
jgi:hypothetical protein